MYDMESQLFSLSIQPFYDLELPAVEKEAF